MMKSPYQIVLCILSIVFIFYGCNSTNELVKKKYTTNFEELDCINLILAKDDSLGRVRNHTSTTLSLSETIKQYVESVNNLNFQDCPQSFTQAFDNHMSAWTTMIQVTDYYPDLRGEMHDLFDKIEVGEHGGLFKPLLKDIWDTWAKVDDAKNGLTQFDIAFEIAENDLVPEGIAYNPKDLSFYVGSTWKRKILRIDSSGSVAEFVKSGQDNLLGVIGLRVDVERQILWVCTSSAGDGMPVQGLTDIKNNRSGIFKYNIQTGKLLQKYWLEAPGQSFFFNDLAIDKNGRLYATEMSTKSIYTINPEADNLELFLSLPSGYTANGIDINEVSNELFVALYAKPNAFGKINISTKKFTTISIPPNELVGADGLYFYKNSLVAVQPFRKNRFVAQYFLNENLDKVEGIQVLMSDNDILNQPTTGTVKDDEFYFIANSQLQRFARHWRESNGEISYDSLESIKIAKVRL